MKPFEANLLSLAFNLPNTKVTKDLGKRYINVRPLLVRHFWLNRLLLRQLAGGKRQTN